MSALFLRLTLMLTEVKMPAFVKSCCIIIAVLSRFIASLSSNAKYTPG